MRKILLPIICFLLLAYVSSLSAFQLFAGRPQAGASQDDCSGTLAYSHHAENDDAADTNANGTYGCSDSETYKSWDTTDVGVTYDNTGGDYNDGGYGVDFVSGGNGIQIDNTGVWIDIDTTGAITFWWKEASGAGDDYIFYIDTGAGYIRGKWRNTGNYPILEVGDGTDTGQLVATNSVAAGGEIIQFSWDLSNGAGADIMAIKVGSNSWETDNPAGDINPGTMPTSFYALGYFSANAEGNGDTYKIYEEYIVP